MIRLVKLTFKPDTVAAFIENFNQNKQHIKNFEGVLHLELLNDKTNPNVFFTYSIWQSEQHLENYRNSALFKSIWEVTKPMFSAKAEAWSVESLQKL